MGLTDAAMTRVELSKVSDVQYRTLTCDRGNGMTYEVAFALFWLRGYV